MYPCVRARTLCTVACRLADGERSRVCGRHEGEKKGDDDVERWEGARIWLTTSMSGGYRRRPRTWAVGNSVRERGLGSLSGIIRVFLSGPRTRTGRGWASTDQDPARMGFFLSTRVVAAVVRRCRPSAHSTLAMTLVFHDQGAGGHSRRLSREIFARQRRHSRAEAVTGMAARATVEWCPLAAPSSRHHRCWLPQMYIHKWAALTHIPRPTPCRMGLSFGAPSRSAIFLSSRSHVAYSHLLRPLAVVVLHLVSCTRPRPLALKAMHLLFAHLLVVHLVTG
jgi:hypothetical protein